MLDTIILTLPKSRYVLMQPERFHPNARILESPGGSLLRCVNNPTAADKAKNVYKPRLTLTRRPTKNGYEIPLKIEFSAPKLLFGNNVDELEESDFEKVLVLLRDRLLDMGVMTSTIGLRSAQVAAFHPSKNIGLDDGYTSSFVIRELQKINVSKKMDLNRDSFRNEGQSLQLYTNAHSLVIYDKVQDLKKPGKRAIDKDHNRQQKTLFDLMVPSERTPEILRIEVRLSKRVAMNAALRKVGYPESPRFQDLFDKALCQKLVSRYWSELIEKQNLFLFSLETKPKKMLEDILRARKTIKPKEAIYLLGLQVAVRDGGGITELRRLLEPRASSRTWYRITDDLKGIQGAQKGKYHAWVGQVQTQIQAFLPYRLSTGTVNKSKV